MNKFISMLGLFPDSRETNDPGPQFIKQRTETPSSVGGRSSPRRTEAGVCGLEIITGV